MKNRDIAIAMAKLRVENLKKKMIARAKKGEYDCKADMEALAEYIEKELKGDNNELK